MPIKFNFKRTHRYNVSAKDLYVIRIYTLDGTCVEYTLSSSTTGRDALEYVAQRLDIDDISVFGLKYEDRTGESRWLFLDKAVKKQLDKYARQHVLLLSIMLFIDNPQFITDPRLRRFFYLQLRQDVATGLLPVTLKLGIKLCAYSLQADFGDFVDMESSLTNWRDRLFITEGTLCGAFDLCNTEYVEDILWGYLHLQGVSQENAMWYFLDEIRNIPRYGVRAFCGMTCKSEPAELGVSRNGITITTLEPQRRVTANLKWEHIKDLTYTKKTFTIQLLKKNKSVHFVFDDSENARYLWQFCIQMHSSYIEYWTHVKSSPQQPAVHISEPPDILRGTEMHHHTSSESPVQNQNCDHGNESPLNVFNRGCQAFSHLLRTNHPPTDEMHGANRSNHDHSDVGGEENIAQLHTQEADDCSVLPANQGSKGSKSSTVIAKDDLNNLAGFLNTIQEGGGTLGDSETGTLVGQWSLRSAADTLDSQFLNKGCVTCLPGRQWLRNTNWFQARAGVYNNTSVTKPSLTKTDDAHLPVSTSSMREKQSNMKTVEQYKGALDKIVSDVSHLEFEENLGCLEKSHSVKHHRQAHETNGRDLPLHKVRDGLNAKEINMTRGTDPSPPSSVVSSDSSYEQEIEPKRASFSSSSSSCGSRQRSKKVESRNRSDSGDKTCSSTSSSISSSNSNLAAICGLSETKKPPPFGLTATLSSRIAASFGSPKPNTKSLPRSINEGLMDRKLRPSEQISNSLRPILNGFTQHHYRPQVQMKRQQEILDAVLNNRQQQQHELDTQTNCNSGGNLCRSASANNDPSSSPSSNLGCKSTMGNRALHEVQRWLLEAKNRIPVVWANTLAGGRRMTLQISSPAFAHDGLKAKSSSPPDNSVINLKSTVRDTSNTISHASSPQVCPSLIPQTSQSFSIGSHTSAEIATQYAMQFSKVRKELLSSAHVLPQDPIDLNVMGLNHRSSDYLITPTIYLYPPTPTQMSCSQQSSQATDLGLWPLGKDENSSQTEFIPLQSSEDKQIASDGQFSEHQEDSELTSNILQRKGAFRVAPQRYCISSSNRAIVDKFHQEPKPGDRMQGSPNIDVPTSRSSTDLRCQTCPSTVICSSSCPNPITIQWKQSLVGGHGGVGINLSHFLTNCDASQDHILHKITTTTTAESPDTPSCEPMEPYDASICVADAGMIESILTTSNSSSDRTSSRRCSSNGPKHHLTNSVIRQLLSLTNIRETELAHRLLTEYGQALLQQQSLHTNSVSTPNLTASQELQMFSSSTAAEDIDEDLEVLDTDNRLEETGDHLNDHLNAVIIESEENNDLQIADGKQPSESHLFKLLRKKTMNKSSEMKSKPEAAQPSDQNVMDLSDYVNAAAFKKGLVGDRTDRPLSLTSSTDIESNGTFRFLSSIETRTSSMAGYSMGGLESLNGSYNYHPNPVSPNTINNTLDDYASISNNHSWDNLPLKRRSIILRIPSHGAKRHDVVPTVPELNEQNIQIGDGYSQPEEEEQQFIQKLNQPPPDLCVGHMIEKANDVNETSRARGTAAHQNAGQKYRQIRPRGVYENVDKLEQMDPDSTRRKPGVESTTFINSIQIHPEYTELQAPNYQTVVEECTSEESAVQAGNADVDTVQSLSDSSSTHSSSLPPSSSFSSTRSGSVDGMIDKSFQNRRQKRCKRTRKLIALETSSPKSISRHRNRIPSFLDEETTNVLHLIPTTSCCSSSSCRLGNKLISGRNHQHHHITTPNQLCCLDCGRRTNMLIKSSSLRLNRLNSLDKLSIRKSGKCRDKASSFDPCFDSRNERHVTPVHFIMTPVENKSKHSRLRKVQRTTHQSRVKYSPVLTDSSSSSSEHIDKTITDIIYCWSGSESTLNRCSTSLAHSFASTCTLSTSSLDAQTEYTRCSHHDNNHYSRGNLGPCILTLSDRMKRGGSLEPNLLYHHHRSHKCDSKPVKAEQRRSVVINSGSKHVKHPLKLHHHHLQDKHGEELEEYDASISFEGSDCHFVPKNSSSNQSLRANRSDHIERKAERRRHHHHGIKGKKVDVLDSINQMKSTNIQPFSSPRQEALKSFKITEGAKSNSIQKPPRPKTLSFSTKMVTDVGENDVTLSQASLKNSPKKLSDSYRILNSNGDISMHHSNSPTDRICSDLEYKLNLSNRTLDTHSKSSNDDDEAAVANAFQIVSAIRKLPVPQTSSANRINMQTNVSTEGKQTECVSNGVQSNSDSSSSSTRVDHSHGQVNSTRRFRITCPSQLSSANKSGLKTISTIPSDKRINSNYDRSANHQLVEDRGKMKTGTVGHHEIGKNIKPIMTTKVNTDGIRHGPSVFGQNHRNFRDSVPHSLPTQDEATTPVGLNSVRIGKATTPLYERVSSTNPKTIASPQTTTRPTFKMSNVQQLRR